MIWILLVALVLAVVMLKLGMYVIWLSMLKGTLQVVIFVATVFGLLLVLRRRLANRRLQRCA